jgi:hypothetical protein
MTWQQQVNLQVTVYQRPHMRDKNLAMEMHMGTQVLRGLFDEERDMPEVTDLFLSFPERWLNIVEERSLYQRLERRCPNLRSVQIKTQSVYIIQCTDHRCLRIVVPPGDEPLPQENVEGRLYFPQTGNLFGDGLNVVSATGVQQLGRQS